MIDETRANVADATEVSPVEVTDQALDAASGGAAYIKFDGVLGGVRSGGDRPSESLSINFTKIQY